MLVVPKSIAPAFFLLSFLLACSSVTVGAFALPGNTATIPANGTAQFEPQAPSHHLLDDDFFTSLRAGEIAELNDAAKTTNPLGPIRAGFSLLRSAVRMLILPVHKLVFVLAKSAVAVTAYFTELVTGGPLIPQSGPFVYGTPFAGNESLPTGTLHLAVQERSFIVIENMYIQGIDGPYCKVSGIRGILTGRDRIGRWPKQN